MAKARLMQLDRFLRSAPPEFAALLPRCACAGGRLDAVKATNALARQELGVLGNTPDPFGQWGDWATAVKAWPG
eukprot:11004531-Alexandrium_andersonii.AAC.1